MPSSCIKNFQQIPKFADVGLDWGRRTKQDVPRLRRSPAHEPEKIVRPAIPVAFCLRPRPVRLIEDQCAESSGFATASAAA